MDYIDLMKLVEQATYNYNAVVAPVTPLTLVQIREVVQRHGLGVGYLVVSANVLRQFYELDWWTSLCQSFQHMPASLHPPGVYGVLYDMVVLSDVWLMDRPSMRVLEDNMLACLPMDHYIDSARLVYAKTQVIYSPVD